MFLRINDKYSVVHDRSLEESGVFCSFIKYWIGFRNTASIKLVACDFDCKKCSERNTVSFSFP